MSNLRKYFIVMGFIVSVFLLSPFLPSSAHESMDSLHAKAAILIEGGIGRVLFGKEDQARLPMASTTKIMTCLYALEHGNLTDVVTFSENAAAAPRVHLGAPAGSQFLLSDLLYALMLESYNDAAVAIAEHISGSVEAFCRDMTREAKDLGCENTSFRTPNGLDKEGHYTTCYDLALITGKALENPNFRKIIAEPSWSIKDLKNKGSYHLQNKDAFLRTYPGAIGVKTGFTSGAGYCFVGAVEASDRLLITVVLGCGWPPHRTWKWEDTKKLMDYGMKNYSMKTISLQDELPQSLPVDRGQPASLTKTPGLPPAGSENQTVKIPILGPDEETLLLSEDETVEVKTLIPKILTAPVKRGDIVGRVTVTINGFTYRSYPVRAGISVKEIDYRYCLRHLIFAFQY